jgi:protein-ribulosamine 3-kinase
MIRSNVPQPVLNWLQDQKYGKVHQLRAVGGGCINNGAVLETESGQSFFLKTNPNAPQDMFEREAEGLEAITRNDGPKVPRPFLAGSNFLLLENLSPAARNRDYWLVFGRKLAALHNHTHDRFGFSNDNYIGSTPQPNTWMQDGHAFFAENRLMFQARLANQRGLLGREDLHQVERVASRLPKFVPVQPASLIHGDLWSGNVMADETGNPAIIDPAAHYGWAEAELGMTTLFGSFPEEFYQAYEEVRPLELGYQERYPIYNLYHLLNHLNLFGRSYLGQVSSILQRYSWD